MHPNWSQEIAAKTRANFELVVRDQIDGGGRYSILDSHLLHLEFEYVLPPAQNTIADDGQPQFANHSLVNSRKKEIVVLGYRILNDHCHNQVVQSQLSSLATRAMKRRPHAA